MIEIEPSKKSGNPEIPLWVRAFSFAVPLTIVQGIILGITGYPVEEWPFVAGVFVICLLLSGCFVTWSLLMVSKKLNDYGRLVLAELGVDVDAAAREVSVPGILWVILGVVFVLLLIGAIWGLALKALVFILQYMAMPPIGTELPLAANVMVFVGVGGLALGLLLNLVLCYLVRQLVRHRNSVSAGIRFAFKVVLGSKQASVFSRTMGIIVRAGTG